MYYFNALLGGTGRSRQKKWNCTRKPVGFQSPASGISLKTAVDQTTISAYRPQGGYGVITNKKAAANPYWDCCSRNFCKQSNSSNTIKTQSWWNTHLSRSPDLRIISLHTVFSGNLSQWPTFVMCEASTHTVAVPFRILTGFLYSPLSLNASQRHLSVYLVVNRIPRIYYFVNRETFPQSAY